MSACTLGSFLLSFSFIFLHPWQTRALFLLLFSHASFVFLGGHAFPSVPPCLAWFRSTTRFVHCPIRGTCHVPSNRPRARLRSHAHNEAWSWNTREKRKEEKKKWKRSESKRTKRCAHGWNNTSKVDATVRPHPSRRTSTCKRRVTDAVRACCARAWTHRLARKHVPKSDVRWWRSRGTSRCCEGRNAPHVCRACRACAPFDTSCDARRTDATMRGRRRAWRPPQIRCYVLRSCVVVEKRWSCTSRTSSPGG